MQAIRSQASLAVQALGRNRTQAVLALVGVVVGVGALVTSLALGRGAQAAIRDQLLAAGVNMIIVTSGNYQVKQPGAGDAPADHGDLRRPQDFESFVAGSRRLQRPGGPGVVAAFYSSLRPARGGVSGGMNWELRPAHFEDDPMAVHDHPTAAQRLGDAMAGLGAAATLSIDDARAIRSELPGVEFVASGVHENARIIVDDAGAKQWFTRLHGTEAELPVIRRGWVFPFGRFLSPAEVDEAAQVMVLGRVVADRLFGKDVDPVGRRVLMWNQPFEVVGVVGSSSWAAQPAPGDDQFDAVYLPVSTVHRLLNLSKLNTITITTKVAGDTTAIAGEITDLLRRRHGISEEMPDDFTVRTQAEQVLNKGLPPELARVVSGNLASVDSLTMEQLASSMQRSNRTLLALLAGVAAVSLLVGGIGVMNLLFLSVTQRTREIGLRMAMGARGRDIAAQFFVEALVLCAVGGVLGALAGTLAAYGLEGVLAWSTDVSPASAVIAAAVALLLGIFSGVLPARRAAKLDPITALHHE
ncbi:MAG: ABC transporter permease [Pseudomonadota bacterium]